MEVGINYWKSNSLRQQWDDLQVVTFFMPLNLLLQIWGSITGWNTTRLQVLMIITATYFLPIPVSKYLKGTGWGTASFTVSQCVCVMWCLENPKALFVSMFLITLMTFCSNAGSFSINHSNNDENTAPKNIICPRAHLKETKEIQPLNCCISGKTTKGVNVVFPSAEWRFVHTQTLSVNIEPAHRCRKAVHLNSLLKWKENPDLCRNITTWEIWSPYLCFFTWIH